MTLEARAQDPHRGPGTIKHVKVESRHAAGKQVIHLLLCVLDSRLELPVGIFLFPQPGDQVGWQGCLAEGCNPLDLRQAGDR